MAVPNRNRFGRSTENLGVGEQIAFMEVDGKIVYFNGAQVVAALEGENRELGRRFQGSSCCIHRP